jgi:hypothetical protein
LLFRNSSNGTEPDKYFGEVDKSNITKLNETATAAQAALFANECALLNKQVTDNEAQIATYKTQLEKLETPESAGDLQNTFATTAGIPPSPQTPPAPRPKSSRRGGLLDFHRRRSFIQLHGGANLIL